MFNTNIFFVQLLPSAQNKHFFFTTLLVTSILNTGSPQVMMFRVAIFQCYDGDTSYDVSSYDGDTDSV